jgi:2-dehydro-3-deoxyphosphogluconate aldolase/(4S)-4-hydroxy-2-oxoglutarate aldolase
MTPQKPDPGRADMVKVFPQPNWGPEYTNIRVQFQILFCSWVNLQNAGAFIKAGAAALGVGGELVDKKAVKEKKFDIITENTRTFLKAIQEARGKGSG